MAPPDASIAEEDARGVGLPLRERLSEIVLDRAASAEELVLETSRVVLDWVLEQPERFGGDGAALEAELAEWNAEQDWRGPCALWMDSVRRTWAWSREAGLPAGTRGVLAEELGLWLWSCDGVEALGEEHAGPWSGEPLAPGRRLQSRTALAERAARTLQTGEVVLVTAWSETVARALEAAWRMGKRPEVLLAEGAPHLDGRRMGRRLLRGGIAVTMCYDAALISVASRADRVWLSTEAIGSQAFLARIGTARLIEECAGQGVPVTVLATSDKLVPGGDLRPPAWAGREGWLLWEDAPEGVRLESQYLQPVALDLPGGFLTEVGEEGGAELHLRALRVSAAPPCGARPDAALSHSS